MGRKPCCSKVGLNKGAWSAMEDAILTNYINTHGDGNWRALPLRAGLKRCGKSCRLRWLNYLRPDIKRGNISPAEEDLIIKLHNLLGNRWSLIAGRLPGRTDNEIKNYWNTTICKKPLHSKPDVNYKVETTTSNDNTQPKAERHEVIRTKAIRCTKVTIPKELETTDRNPNCLVPSWESNYETPASSSSTHQSNFLMDFDIDELLMPDLINPCLEHPNDLGDGQFWRSTEEFSQNEPIDFKELASFLDSEINLAC